MIVGGYKGCYIRDEYGNNLELENVQLEVCLSEIHHERRRPYKAQ
jgi:hypothetical protein